MGLSKTDWLAILLVFNIVVVTLAGFYGDYLNEAGLTTVSEATQLALPGVALNVVTGFAGAPAWLNLILAAQFVIAIYILLATILPGGG